MKDIVSEIIGRVSAEMKVQAGTVTAGTNIHSFEDYKQYIGRLHGLQIALDIVNEILTENDEQES